MLQIGVTIEELLHQYPDAFWMDVDGGEMDTNVGLYIKSALLLQGYCYEP